MLSMFYCAGYKATKWSIGDLSGWNTVNVTEMESMFSFCENLTNVYGIEEFDTSSVTNMSSMFLAVSGNLVLDLGGWYVCDVEEYDKFSDGLGNIIEPDWTKMYC